MMRSLTRRLAVMACLLLITTACGTSTQAADGDSGTDAGDAPDTEKSADDGGAEGSDPADEGTDSDEETGSGQEMSVEEITELLFPSFDESGQAAMEAQFADEKR